MRSFEDAVGQVKSSIAKLLLFEIIMNAFIVYLFIYLFVFLFFDPMRPAIIGTVIYVTIFSVRRFRLNKIRKVEQKYPNLREKFQTAVEYHAVENPIVNELQAEVLRDLKRVEEASFFNTKDTLTKVIILILLCLFIFSLSPASQQSPFHISIPGIPGVRENPRINLGEPGDQAPQAEAGGSEEGGTLFGDDNIYGSAFVAPLGEEEVTVTFNPGGHEINMRQVHEVEPVDFDEAYPDEVFASSGEVFEENIPKEQQELVKKYFNQLAQGE